jgi:hypothetical protein
MAKKSFDDEYENKRFDMSERCYNTYLHMILTLQEYPSKAIAQHIFPKLNPDGACDWPLYFYYRRKSLDDINPPNYIKSKHDTAANNLDAWYNQSQSKGLYDEGDKKTTDSSKRDNHVKIRIVK